MPAFRAVIKDAEILTAGPWTPVRRILGADRMKQSWVMQLQESQKLLGMMVQRSSAMVTHRLEHPILITNGQRAIIESCGLAKKEGWRILLVVESY